MIPIKRIVKDYLEAGSLESLVNIHAAIDDRTFLTHSGHLFTVLKADAPDDECLEAAQLDQAARSVEAALRSFDERFQIRQYLLKRSHLVLGESAFSDPVVRQLHANRAAYLRERSDRLFALDIYWVVTYTGWQPDGAWRSTLTGAAAHRGAAILGAFSTEAAFARIEEGLDRARATLAEKVDGFIVQLRDALPLAVLARKPAFHFLRRLLNYAPAKADARSLTDARHVGFQAADSTLECHRDHLRLDDYYVQVLTLKEPPARTTAHLLRDLAGIASPLIVASEWTREEDSRMRRLIHAKRRHLNNTKTSLAGHLTASSQTTPKDLLADTGAERLVDNLGGCLEELDVNGRHFGQFSMTLVLYDLDRGKVQRAAAECLKVFAAQDARLVEERYNLLNAFLSLLPGSDAFNLRRLYLLNTNHADLSFVFAPRTGERVNAHLSREHLAVLESEQGTPYFFNLHYQDVAHTLILGATGSGKTFLLNFLIAFLQKYSPQTFIFDLGGGYDRLAEAFHGSRAALNAAERAFAINPFCLPPTSENLHFLASFCRVLIESGGYVMTAADQKDLVEQIENVYAVEPDQRRLLTLANIVNRHLRMALQRWVAGGPYGSWFDNVRDTVTLAAFQTFNFEGLGDHPQLLEPLLFYVLHRANTAIYARESAGQFKVFVMDEAWRFFRHTVIKLYIVEALKTWRKKNAAMILATQSADDLRQSELLPVVVESCPTQMFLANPGMDREVYRELFHLNGVEAERIAGLIPKQQLLLKRPDLAKVLNLNVDPASHRLFAGGAVETATLLQAVATPVLASRPEIPPRSHP